MTEHHRLLFRVPISFPPLLLAIVLPLIFFAQPPEAKMTKTIHVDGAAMEMVYIPAGEFLMGAKNGWEDERPVHLVRISKGFWLGRTEITQEFWNAVMKANPAAFRKGNDHPVEGVSWQDCQLFIRKLNARNGFAFRLPTEAEWEYAARAGKGGERPIDLDAVAWFAGNSAGSPHAVGTKQPNAFGLYDMLGNVWEWCSDWYEKEYYWHSPRIDPRGAAMGTHRVDRGGAWAYGPDIVRPGRRDGSGPDYRTDLIGLRLAADRLDRR